MSDDTPTMRAADNDREAIVERLTRAQAEGRLDLSEFDHRVQQAWTAQTYADLAALIADLPPDNAPTPKRPDQQIYQHQTYRPQTYQHPVHLPEPQKPNRAAQLFFRAWVAASMINFVIWGLVSITNLEWTYPWWIWVAGPWGALILAGRMTRFGQQG
ncbi:MAG TPA: DUF1707 domain-containing protein [Umezawaea sp.]|nr:DUF1707 domain-containing protein [Umezawaea sp.]